MNNAVHLDWLDEAVRHAARPDTPPAFGTLPRRYRVEYLAPLAMDESVALSVWPSDDGWSALLARGSDGREVARAELIGEGRSPSRALSGPLAE